ncbi:MAG: hypothetical protein ACTHMS_14430 [Jatrophihabitans sp.]|uniref:hypothetical protein n=1 Tax=Jatrophihabitans sp. TaxID=1932789 RepID=UPI003F7DE068
MSLAASHSALAITLWVLAGLVLLAVVSAVVGRAIIRRGLREPFVVRAINRASDKVVDAVKLPITIAVLDEVADVLRTGHYTRNIAAALKENRGELKQMVAEKIKNDPTAGAINLVLFHDRIIDVAAETALRVILEVLADARTDELISDLLRDNIDQIRADLRSRQ